MSLTGLQIPFGAVYFRKSNPPREDWDRDYKTAAEDGLNIFRHWFMWSAIERKPGHYDWDDYDRQLDLGDKYGIKTVIAELTHTVPDWAYRKFAHARQCRADGIPLPSTMGVSAATGGFAPNGGGAGSLTLNCPDVRDAAGAFLEALSRRYKGHPSLLGYDVWNECNYSPTVDFNEFTKSAFRKWLQEKYGSLDVLAAAWYRFSYAEWEDIEPPTQTAPYPECIDWIQFKRDNYYDQMQFRINTIRGIDTDCMIAAHGVAGAITDMAARGCDDWLAASKVQLYGYTWIAARKGNQPWRNFFGADLVRSAARGKPYWHAERQGGPLWMQPQVFGRDPEDGRIAEPEDIRLWSLTSFAAGARGMLNLRFRPLLDGPLFGAFGSYAMDGSRTKRSAIASKIAVWANDAAQSDLMNAKPCQGDIGILVVPEVQQFDYLLSHEGNFDTYSAAMWGAYQGFFDNNIQADWVHIEDMAEYDCLYFPYPIMFTDGQATQITDWVANGGTLISEACPGYFGNRGRVGTLQPNMGLDRVFGVLEADVEFMPDIGDRIRFQLDGRETPGAGFLQSYTLAGGKPLGNFTDGRLAIVSHQYGKGRTVLIGTHPSAAYYRNPTEAGRQLFAQCLKWAGKVPNISCSNPKVQVRLQHSDNKQYLWMVNSSRQTQTGHVTVGGHSLPSGASSPCWPSSNSAMDGNRFTVTERDVLIVDLTG